jgi:hypothetical protein
MEGGREGGREGDRDRRATGSKTEGLGEKDRGTGGGGWGGGGLKVLAVCVTLVHEYPCYGPWARIQILVRAPGHKQM